MMRDMDRTKPRAAFTIAELIVVITVIALLLAIAVPGLSKIGQDSRLSAARQAVNGALTNAYYSALADVNLAAIRFQPGEWDFDPAAEKGRPVGRQHLVVYSYVNTSSADPSDIGRVRFGEYFQRRQRSVSVELPADVWAAPVEALDTNQRRDVFTQRNYANFGRDFWLTGTRGNFALNAADPSADFLKADDFLVVFDPRTGLRGGPPTPLRLRAYDPVERVETDARGSGPTAVPYQRYSATGIVLYQRQQFVAQEQGLAGQPLAAARQDWLRDRGRPYLVHRFGGGLVLGVEGRP